MGGNGRIVRQLVRAGAGEVRCDKSSDNGTVDDHIDIRIRFISQIVGRCRIRWIDDIDPVRGLEVARQTSLGGRQEGLVYR